MHIHGYNFHVVAMGRLPPGTNAEDVKQMDQEGNLLNVGDKFVEVGVVQHIILFFLLFFVSDSKPKRRKKGGV